MIVSTDFSIKPVVTQAVSTPAKQISVAADSGIRTDLPPSQSVTATDTSASLRNDAQSSSGQLSHQVIVDHNPSAIVYQVVDELTGVVVNQFPDEATLRRRAYFHTLDMMKTEQSDQPKTVRNA